MPQSTATLTPLQKKLKRLRSDPRYFIEKNLSVVSKGALVDFKLNPAQEHALEAIQRQQSRGKPVRVITLKARREGISTLYQALMFHKISFYKNRNAMVVAHELTSSKEIFEMSRRFYQSPKYPSIRPMIRSLESKKLHYDNPDPKGKRGLDSKLTVETAMDVQAGRSMEINYLHLSEMAFYRDPDTLMTGLLQCVDSTNPDTMIFMESTANGVGGYFYDFVQTTLKGENDYILVFLPWFIDPRYTHAIDGDFNNISEEDRRAEERIRTLYKWDGKRVTLTNEQLYWRRKKIANDFKGDSKLFQQEYPGSIDEAFISSGRLRFDHARLAEIQSEARPPVFVGYIHQERTQKGRKFNLEKSDKGYLKIYEKPVKGAEYVLFADVSEGKLLIPGRADTADYSSIDVLRCDTMEQVAHWHGRIAPELLAAELLKLGRYYNEGFLTAEKNNMGYDVIARIKNYPRTYIRLQHDRNGKEITRDFGWVTTLKTKPRMINILAELISSKEIKINDPITLEELRRFSTLDDGSFGAPPGLHDDCVISLAGAVQMYAHSYVAPPKKSSYDDDYAEEEEEYEEDDD